MNAFRLLFVALVLSCLVAMDSRAADVTPPAGGFKVEDAKEPKKEDLRNFIPTLRAGQIPEEETAAFDGIVKFYVAEFTLPSNVNLLPKKRYDLKTKLKTASNAPIADAHKRLRTLVRTGMMRQCGPEYHPFVRVNSMLVLAEMNEKEAPPDNKDPPIVDLDTLKFMIKAVEDPKQLDAVKAAALMGIDRNARLGIKDERVAADVLKLAIEISKPNNHEWLRRRGVMLIAAQGLVGKNAEAPKVLQELIANPKEPLALRCAAARAFGSLDFSTGPRIPFTLPILQLAHLSVEVLEKTKPKTGWNAQEMFATEAFLRDIEIGLRGRPDPQPSFQEKPPDRGMLLVLTGLEDPQRKLLDEFASLKFAPVAKIVYAFQPDKEKDLEVLISQLISWAQAHPTETGKPPADKTAAKDNGASTVAKP